MPKGGYKMMTFSDLMMNVMSGDGQNSLLWQRVDDLTIPKGSETIPATDRLSIKQWIDGRAQNN